MSDHKDMLPTEDNFLLLDQAYMLLRAVHDLLLNDSSDIFRLVYACEDAAMRKSVLHKLNLLQSSILGLLQIAQTLSCADRSSWER